MPSFRSRRRFRSRVRFGLARRRVASRARRIALRRRRTAFRSRLRGRGVRRMRRRSRFNFNKSRGSQSRRRNSIMSLLQPSLTQMQQCVASFTSSATTTTEGMSSIWFYGTGIDRGGVNPVNQNSTYPVDFLLRIFGQMDPTAGALSHQILIERSVLSYEIQSRINSRVDCVAYYCKVRRDLLIRPVMIILKLFSFAAWLRLAVVPLLLAIFVIGSISPLTLQIFVLLSRSTKLSLFPLMLEVPRS